MLFLAITVQLFSRDISVNKPSGTYIHSMIKSREKTIHSVTLLPPAVARQEVGWFNNIKTDELDSEESMSDPAHIVSEALRRRGWKVDESALSAQAVQKDEKLRNLVDYLRSRYETLALQMLNKPKDVSKGRYSLGEDVAKLAPFAPADAFAFVRSYFYGRYDNKMLCLNISLVDPQSGEVLILCNIRHMTPTGKYDTEKKIQYILKELSKIP
jgi:hypothetical protein